MFNVSFADDLLYGKWLFTWLSLVMSSMMFNFVLSICPEMSYMRSGFKLSPFLSIFLPTLIQICLA